MNLLDLRAQVKQRLLEHALPDMPVTDEVLAAVCLMCVALAPEWGEIGRVQPRVDPRQWEAVEALLDAADGLLGHNILVTLRQAISLMAIEDPDGYPQQLFSTFVEGHTHDAAGVE
jgi:hypothetical protein